MPNQNYLIEAYTDKDREQVLLVWERSVIATHGFLSPADFIEIKALVQTINFNDFEVFCLKLDNEVVGFIGLAERKIEMLFFVPEYIGKGLGKKLTDYALSDLKADKVDVNEQNIKALRFYEKLGFRTFERTDKDDQGKEYPLLRMKLENTENN